MTWYKHIDALNTEDHTARIEAQRTRQQWFQERQQRPGLNHQR